MFIDKILDRTNCIKKALLLTLISLLLLVNVFIITPANGAKVYHCLQANGTKAYQERLCEENKKTVAVIEQKIRKESFNGQASGPNIVGKWALDGISSSPDGEIQKQEEKISWTFSADGKVTYQYQDKSAVYGYTTAGEKINIPDSSIGSFEIIKNQGSTAVWKTGTTYYFLTLSSII